MYIYFPFIRYALLKNQFHSDEMNPKASTAASSGRNSSNESDSEGGCRGSHINDSNCGSNISSTKMTTAVLNSTFLPFKMANKKKARKKNCHVNGNFEIESIIILLLTSSWLPFVVYNEIIKKMWKERPNRIELDLHCYLIGLKRYLMRSLSKLSRIRLKTQWLGINLFTKKGAMRCTFICHVSDGSFFVPVQFFYVSLAEN